MLALLPPVSSTSKSSALHFRVLEGDKDWVPTGRILPVGGTPFDLRASKRLGDVIDEDEIRFHHNFCVATHGSKVD